MITGVNVAVGALIDEKARTALKDLRKEQEDDG